MKIGLLGCGTIGYGVYELIASKRYPSSSNLELVKALVKTPEEITMSFMTNDPDEILENDEIETVVEVMGGIHPAYEFISRAMKKGKNIVTANKAVVAAYFDEFVDLAMDNHVKFRYEASVGGGIPWINSLRQAQRIDNITSVSGIMNGTTNYILSTMEAEGIDFDICLKNAQQKGYAEANPAADIDGIDIRNKLAISSSLAFSSYIKGDVIPTKGIRDISIKDIEYFTSIGKSVRLYADARLENGSFACRIEPALFDGTSPEASVYMNNNIFTLYGETIGELKFIGQGAGRYPTAYNVMQDCVDVMKGIGFYSAYGEKVAANNAVLKQYYVRGGSVAEDLVAEQWGEGVLTKPVSVSAMHAWLKENSAAFIAALA